MSSSVPESDWKIFREIREIALDRYCLRILDEISRIANDPNETSHKRYLKIYAIIHERDRTLGRAFNDSRRSTAFLQLLAIQSLELFTEMEFARFSQETRDRVSTLLDDPS